MRRMLLLTTVLTAIVATAVPAAAVKPTTVVFPFADVIEGFVPSCGLNLRWEISGEAERTFFRDQDGDLVRIQDKVRETNTITNLDTGETLREGPDAFSQRILFNPDGTVTLQINGLSVHVPRGDGSVVDAGRVVLLFGPGGPTVLDVAGRHDVRGIDPLVVDDPVLLEGFCPAFS